MSTSAAAVSAAIRKAVAEAISALHIPQVVWAVVTAVEAGPPPSITVQQQGSASTNAGVRYVGLPPVVGDTVICFAVASDLWSIGSINPDPGFGIYAATVLDSDTYASSTYGDTAHPCSVSAVIGHRGAAIVTVSANMQPNTYPGGETIYCGLSIDGDAPIAAIALSNANDATSVGGDVSGTFLVGAAGGEHPTPLIAGPHTFALQFAVSTDTVSANIDRRSVVVQAL